MVGYGWSPFKFKLGERDHIRSSLCKCKERQGKSVRIRHWYAVTVSHALGRGKSECLCLSKNRLKTVRPSRIRGMRHLADRLLGSFCAIARSFFINFKNYEERYEEKNVGSRSGGVITAGAFQSYYGTIDLESTK